MQRGSWLLLLGLLGCGGNDGAGPDSFEVTGTWSTSWTNLAGGGASCNSTSPTQLILNQTGGTVSGSYSGGEVFCSGPAGPGSIPVGSGLVSNGTIDGRDISFDLAISETELHHTGTVSATTMSGTAQWSIDFGIPVGVVTLSGSWSAAKQ